LFFVSPVNGEVLIDFSAPEKVFNGEPFLVTLSCSSELKDLEIAWQNNSFHPSVAKEGGVQKVSLLLGTDSKDSSHTDDLIYVRGNGGGETFAFSWQVKISPKNYPRESLTVSRNMVHPPADVLSRIKKEREQIRKALNTHTSEPQWTLPFLRPVAGDITSCYGKRRVYNGIPKNRHGGTDFRAAIGTPVRAAASGRVILAGDHYFAGKSIYLDHGNGVVSMYFHLSAIGVTSGQKVARGDVIGRTGCTGRVTGPHLHFGVSIKGKMIDPMFLVKMDRGALSRGNRSVRFSP
jgi:murein DD-endopeptidase MepM/ murein hydrolase activator NlpD